MPKFYAPLDLRKELRELLNSVGARWVALRSVDLDSPCLECKKATSSAYSDAPIKCTICQGIGFAYIDKLTKAYSYRGSQGLDERTNIGIVNTENLIWIFEHNVFPKTADYVLELDLNEKTGIPRQPFSIIKGYKISDTQEMIGDDSRIEFWRCYSEEANLDLGKSLA